MNLSVLDLFKIGIGPSSSHTVGPMHAGRMFVEGLMQTGLLPQVARIQTELFGSLGATGKGHRTDHGVLFGLMGEHPERVDIDSMEARLAAISASQSLPLPGGHVIAFSLRHDILFLRRNSPAGHPNALSFSAFDGSGQLLRFRTYLSVGGGFVEEVAQPPATSGSASDTDTEASALPWPFSNARQLLAQCHASGLSIAALVAANEAAMRPAAATEASLFAVWDAMQSCISRGCRISGTLPGPLQLRRRASTLYQQHMASHAPRDPLDWLNLYAMAVNEENAAGGRVVTAPTNGAAGIIPALLRFHLEFSPQVRSDDVLTFLYTAGAIGMLYKRNASISGAAVGCQGEVGVACSMAAAGLCAVLGGTPEQVENAAEIGMEHNLGLTCDPVGGQVQIPCIERNAMGAVKALNAAKMALAGDGRHQVSLDSVIKTMHETGADMKLKYKETSRGGLALNVIAC